MDLINRQDVIDMIMGDGIYCDTDDDKKYSAERIMALPTVEPKRGEWIPVVDGHYIIWECSECHVESEAWTDFCPICGSRNIEEMDEDGGVSDEADRC